MDNVDVKIVWFELLERVDDGEYLCVELVVLEVVNEGVKPREEQRDDFWTK